MDGMRLNRPLHFRLLTLCVSLLLVGALVGVAPVAAAGAVSGVDDASPPDRAFGVDDAAASADDADFPVTLTDATGTEVTIEERPERVTTTNPSAAQIMWELGAEDQVVGLTQFAHYLENAETRENVSSTELGVSVERVVGTEPDLVLAPNATSTDTVETLREAGLTVYHFSEATDFDDVAEKTTTVGTLTGNSEAAAETNEWMWENVEAIETLTADAEQPRVMYPLLGGFSVGNGTFIHEIIVASGGENVVADEFDGYQVVSDEVVLKLDPEVLIITDQTEGQIIESEPYSLTTAAQTNRTAMLEVNYLNQAAPRSVVYSTRNLSAQLHPDLIDEPSAVADAAESEQSDDVSVSTPGFGPVAALVALVSLIVFAVIPRRRDTD